MECNQSINCNILTCKYNNGDKEKCELKEIKVSNMRNKEAKTSAESMCASYQYEF